MTQEHRHHPAGTLATATTLAAVAGFIDAFIYVNVTPVFVANMSGNLIHLGVFLGLSGWHEAIGPTVALIAFLGGVVLATVHHDRELSRVGAVRADFLLAVEAGLVLTLPLLLTLLDIGFTTRMRFRDIPVICLAALAMGIQASALRRVGSIAVATTYGTGAIVRIGEKTTLAARRADQTTSHRRRITVAILVAVLVSYVAGAVVAAAIGAEPALLLIPAAALIVLAIGARRTTLTT